MEKIYLLEVETEDGETYRFAYDYKPNKKEIKDCFFEHTGPTYEIEDWGICISHKIHELKLINK